MTVDELLGNNSAKGLGDICLNLKDYFTALPEKEAFEKCYRIAALLHEIAVTDGCKNFVPWDEKDYAVGNISDWGLSICSEPEGSTGRMGGNVFSLWERPLRHRMFLSYMNYPLLWNVFRPSCVENYVRSL